jgi:histone RNA hairpin-binding protein
MEVLLHPTEESLLKEEQAEKKLWEDRVAKRNQKIWRGKNTSGYQHYLVVVPKATRNPKNKLTTQPVTPNASIRNSWRNFESQIRRWRRMLHQYDPPGLLPLEISQQRRRTV